MEIVSVVITSSPAPQGLAETDTSARDYSIKFRARTAPPRRGYSQARSLWNSNSHPLSLALFYGVKVPFCTCVIYLAVSASASGRVHRNELLKDGYRIYLMLPPGSKFPLSPRGNDTCALVRIVFDAGATAGCSAARSYCFGVGVDSEQGVVVDGRRTEGRDYQLIPRRKIAGFVLTHRVVERGVAVAAAFLGVGGGT